MTNACCIVLAAGEGSRMKTDMPKVLSPVLFKPMLKWVLDAVLQSGIRETCIVTGYKFELVNEFLNSLNERYETVIQSERNGTAHAVIMANNFLQKHIDNDVLILNGDGPFLDSDTIFRAYKLHKESKNQATIISAKISDPTGYGRIIRDKKSGNVISIVEQKDADDSTKRINEVNSGAYWFNVRSLLSVLGKINNDNSQGEFYLTDAISLLINQNQTVGSYTSYSESTVLGANNLAQLNKLNEIARKKILNNLMELGVNIPCIDGILIGADVTIGKATTILPGTVISGATTIGEHCYLGPNSVIKDCIIKNNCTLCSVYCENSKIENNGTAPPFSVIKDVDRHHNMC